jgi:hypothetical protein
MKNYCNLLKVYYGLIVVCGLILGTVLEMKES